MSAVGSTTLVNGAPPVDDVIGSSLFSILCQKRGWTADFLLEVNDPSHKPLQNLDLMLDELVRIRDAGEQIVVLPDFDMDGITSGSLAWAGLSELGFDTRLYIPDYRRGHDISVDTVQEIRDQFPAARAIITTDSGINSNEGIAAAKRLGFVTLVTDHHLELEPGSVADIAVNPAGLEETYEHPGICGAFVVHQVLEAFADRHAPEHRISISMLKLFAGIGTVSDVMPLRFENRKMVRDSLAIARLLYVAIPPEDTVTVYDIENSTLMQLLRSKPHHPAFVSVFEGFALMMKAFRDHRKPIIDEEGEPVLDQMGNPTFARGKLLSMVDLNEEFYAFYLSPAFNAIRRIGGAMFDGFGVFCAGTAAEKYEHAKAIIDGNEKRKELSAAYIEQLWETEQPLAEFGVYFTDAPTGMLGLIASSVMNDTGRPTVVVRTPASETEPVGGSARSPFWFPIISTMTEFGYRAVGHENACGVGVGSLAELSQFATDLREQSDAIYARLLASGELASSQAADLTIGPEEDCDAPLKDVDQLFDLTESIATLAPFGHAFERPSIELVIDLAKCSIATLGADSTHLRIILPIGMKVLWWNAAERYSELLEKKNSPVPGESVLRARVTLSINVFRGNESVQAIINEIIEAPAPVAEAGWGLS